MKIFERLGDLGPGLPVRAGGTVKDGALPGSTSFTVQTKSPRYKIMAAPNNQITSFQIERE